MTLCDAKPNVFVFSARYAAGTFNKIIVEFMVKDENSDDGFAANLGGWGTGQEVPCWMITNLIPATSGDFRNPMCIME